MRQRYGEKWLHGLLFCGSKSKVMLQRGEGTGRNRQSDLSSLQTTGYIQPLAARTLGEHSSTQNHSIDLLKTQNLCFSILLFVFYLLLLCVCTGVHM